MPKLKDISVIGGGLVGLCAALLLQHPARRVTLLEAGSLVQQDTKPLNARSIALSISSVKIFQALNIWSSIQAYATPIRHIHISARGRWGVTRLQAQDMKLDALGYVIASHDLGLCLQQAVAACRAIDYQTEAQFETIQQQLKVSIGYVKQGRQKKTESAIALIADGANSRARAALGIGHQTIDYGQSVIICNVEVSKPGNDIAFERFTEQGPLAMLPLGKNRYACVWTLTPELAERMQLLDEAGFIEALQRSFGFRLGYIERIGERYDMALLRTRAEALQQQRCFLVGNAANALHPVAGQSFNLSLRDLACLYELLAGQQLSALDNDAVKAIAAEYERQRLAEQAAVIRFGDGLVTLFSNELPLFGRARAAALALLDISPPLKTQVALAGMGMSFGGNRLLRGHL